MRKSWLIAVLCALVLGAGGAALAVMTPPTYKATTELYVAVPNAASASDLAQGASAAEQKIQSFVAVASSAEVLQPAAEELGLTERTSEIAERISVASPVDSVLLDITATGASPQDAANLANTVGKSLAHVVSTKLERSSAQTGAFQITTIAPADEPLAPASPDLPVNVALGMLLGVAIGLGVGALRGVLDNRLESRADVEALAQVSVLGAIPFDRTASELPLLVHGSPQTARNESYRRLRTNLQFIAANGAARSLTVTSSVQSEGKTTTTTNLAIALAQSGQRVVLIDGDLRRPNVARLTGIEGEYGLTDLLIGRGELDTALQPWGRDGLMVLPSGPIPPNPTELLESPAMRLLIAELEASFDVVLIDAPPLLPVADAVILANLTGGALVIAAMQRTTRKQLAAARTIVNDAGANVRGAIMTMVKPRRGDISTYAYGYSEDHDASTRHQRKARKELNGVDVETLTSEAFTTRKVAGQQ